MKTFKIIVLAILGIIILFSVLFFLFKMSERSYNNIQENYFDKSSYYIEGKAFKYKYLGGINSLIYIKVDSINFDFNKLTYSDNFAGLYDSNSNIAIMINIFNYPDVLEKKESNISIQIKVNTKERKIIYLSEKYNDSVTLRPSNVYERYLTKIEKENVGFIRF